MMKNKFLGLKKAHDHMEIILYKTELENAQCLLELPAMLASREELELHQGLGLEREYFRHLNFLFTISYQMVISENGDCVVVPLESEAFAKNFIIVYFAGKIDGSGNEMKQKW